MSKEATETMDQVTDDKQADTAGSEQGESLDEILTDVVCEHIEEDPA